MDDADGVWLIRAELLEIHRRPWMRLAACRGQTDLMVSSCHSPRAAQVLCAGCPVKRECLEYALQLPEGPLAGVWGGMSARQLNRLRQERQRLIVTPSA